MRAPPARPPAGCITIDAAIGATGMSKSSIYNHIASGRIRTVKDGRRTFVLVVSLRPFLPKAKSA